MTKRRVVITGLGLISPVGNTVATAWEAILKGQSGVGPITHFDADGFAVRIAAEVKGFDPTRHIEPKEARKMDTFIQYGVVAALQAMDDAGLGVEGANPERVGVCIGSGIGGLPGIEEGHRAFLRGGPRKITPFFVPRSIVNMIAGHLSIMRGLKGPNLAVATACTTATHSIGLAARTIAYGDADAMVAGGAEMATTYTGLGGFAAAKALSTRNDDPGGASRPWDRGRDGFVLGEGAGVLVLEELEYAKRRGATPYAEVLGFGMSGDAYHMTAPEANGDGARRCMVNALRDAGLSPEQVDYINAHATSTQVGDLAEARAVEALLGERAQRIPVSSTKSMTGHLLGAAGGIEAIFTVLALGDGVAPPTINLHDVDPECRLNCVPFEPQSHPMAVALSNSFGFGGTNATVVFGARP